MSIATIKHVHDRCEEVGECWVWQQGTNGSGYPMSSIDGVRGVRVQRWVYMQQHGRALPRNRYVSNTCGNRLCCNPAHLALRTYSDVLRDRHARNRTAASQARMLQQCIRNLGTPRLDMAAARRIRDRLQAGETPNELARAYGVHPETIRNIRSGKTWRETASSSIFNWRPAA